MLKDKFLLSGLMLIILLVLLLFIVPLADQQLHLDRFDAMAKCFSDRQIPCRWVPGLENFYGSPIFNYTAPLSYYFGGLIFSITRNLPISVRIIFSVSLVGSYIFIYLFTSRFLDKSKAIHSAFFYSLLVFLAIVFHKEGLGVAWGLMFFPLILLNLNSLKKFKVQNFLFFSLSLSLFILSADVAPILIGLIFLWTIFQYIRMQSFTFLLFGLSSILFAFLLSSFYIFPSIWERNLLHDMSKFSYLPKSAAEKPQTVINSSYQILTGDLDISNFNQGTNWLKFEANTREHTIIRLSQFYFPNWKIYVDGKEVAVEYKNNSLGLMTIILGQGNHQVEAKLYDTSIRSFANLLSLAGIIIFAILILVSSGRVRKWATYYRKRMN